MASDDGGDSNPFMNPLFAEFQRAMAASGPLQWDVARQTALMTATQGVAEHNVDPQRRIAIEGLADIVAMRVADVTGGELIDTSKLEIVNRATWVQLTLDAWRPLFDALARGIAGTPPSSESASDQATNSANIEDAPSEDDPMMGMLSGISKMIAPSMLGMSVGTMVGRLATHTFGQYDLPLPREPHGRLVLVGSNLDAFAHEWSLSPDDVAIWALTHEFVSNTVFAAGHLRSAISRLVISFAGGFRPNPMALTESLGAIDVSSGDPMKILNSLLGDPTVLIGASRSTEQDRLAPVLDAALAAMVGYIDHLVDRAAAQLLGKQSRVSEAVRRQRVGQTSDRVFVERLLGVNLTTQQVALAQHFVAGVLERAGETGLAQLRTRSDALPTPAEFAAPGLWLARLEASN